MKHRITLAALVLSMFAAPAFAQASRWYAGVSAGQARTDSDLVANRESTVVGGSVVGSAFDAKDGAYKIAAGYSFSPHLAVELNYADLGTSRLVTSVISQGVGGSVTMHRSIEGLGADLVLRAPIAPRASLLGRIGAVHSRLEAEAVLDGNIVFTGGAGERSRSTTRKETVTRVGIGGEWAFDRGIGLRVEWERWLSVGKPFAIGGTGTTGEADNDFYSVGLVYRF